MYIKPLKTKNITHKRNMTW